MVGLSPLRIEENFSAEASLVVYEGDCRELLARIPSGSVTLVVTSPPYNIGKPYERRLRLDE